MGSALPYALYHDSRCAAADDPMLRAAEAVIARAKAESWPLIDGVCEASTLRAIEQHIAVWRAKGLDHLVVLGTGGSSLGAKTLLALPQRATDVTVSILDNASPFEAEQLLATLEPKRTAILAVSKSGGTIETLSHYVIMRAFMKQALGTEAYAAQVLAISAPGNNPLRQMAAEDGVIMWDHPEHLSGRYSVLSVVGLLPAAFAGLDIYALHASARAVWESVCHHDASMVVQGAACLYDWMQHYPINVLMPYGSGLNELGAWYRQLWAESLGKDGKGSTPICFQGAVDQHSQLQLYLDGPQDKSYTFVVGAPEGRGPSLGDLDTLPEGLAYLQQNRLGDVLAALQQGTIDTFIQHALPVRRMVYEHMDESVMGALLMHFMLETIMVAERMQVNPFDQPAVEEGKKRARDYLAKGAMVAKEAAHG